jgi:hypothetical protein
MCGTGEEYKFAGEVDKFQNSKTRYLPANCSETSSGLKNARGKMSDEIASGCAHVHSEKCVVSKNAAIPLPLPLKVHPVGKCLARSKSA